MEMAGILKDQIKSESDINVRKITSALKKVGFGAFVVTNPYGVDFVAIPEYDAEI